MSAHLSSPMCLNTYWIHALDVTNEIFLLTFYKLLVHGIDNYLQLCVSLFWKFLIVNKRIQMTYGQRTLEIKVTQRSYFLIHFLQTS